MAKQLPMTFPPHSHFFLRNGAVLQLLLWKQMHIPSISHRRCFFLGLLLSLKLSALSVSNSKTLPLCCFRGVKSASQTLDQSFSLLLMWRVDQNRLGPIIAIKDLSFNFDPPKKKKKRFELLTRQKKSIEDFLCKGVSFHDVGVPFFSKL